MMQYLTNLTKWCMAGVASVCFKLTRAVVLTGRQEVCIVPQGVRRNIASDESD